MTASWDSQSNAKLSGKESKKEPTPTDVRLLQTLILERIAARNTTFITNSPIFQEARLINDCENAFGKRVILSYRGSTGFSYEWVGGGITKGET